MVVLVDYNSGNKRPGASYYYTHCKNPGHSMERCFRLNGFPPGFKGFKDKRAAVASHTIEDTTPPSSSESQTITVTQYHQLMDMLNKHKVDF